MIKYILLWSLFFIRCICLEMVHNCSKHDLVHNDWCTENCWP